MPFERVPGAAGATSAAFKRRFLLVSLNQPARVDERGRPRAKPHLRPALSFANASTHE
jgi:hypothetical protein